MIRDLADQGKTILISSHILTELAEICDSVGIIEQGRLLASGSVDEIQHQREQRRELVLRVLSDPSNAKDKIRHELQLEEVIVDGELIRFEFKGDMQKQSQFVSWLVHQGIEIAEVKSHQKSLEDVFLSVTEGLVQ
jgi:ABC-2 type transport system ATP-binding protein